MNSDFVEEMQAGAALLRRYADGIVHLSFSADIEVTEEELDAEFEVLKKITAGHTCALLVDMRRHYINSTREAREHTARNATTETRIADALLVDNTAATLLSNFYIRFNKPALPTRLFTSEAKALRWLRSELEKAAARKEEALPENS